jgi:hypothetical protein
MGALDTGTHLQETSLGYVIIHSSFCMLIIRPGNKIYEALFHKLSQSY